MTSSPFHLRKNRISRAGFSLSELLVVLSIIAILSSGLISSLSGIKGESDITTASTEIAGVMEQARTQAMAGSTYTWVGIFEEDPTVPSTAPQTGGIGQLVVAVMASSDGSNLATSLITNGSVSQLPGASLMQITKLLKIPNVHVDTTISTSGAITFPATTGTFTPYEVDPTSANTSNATINFPFSGSARYTFSQIIQFNPQGDASEIYTSPTQAIDIGLRLARGHTPITAGNQSKNVAIVRLQGIGGKVTIYRP